MLAKPAPILLLFASVSSDANHSSDGQCGDGYYYATPHHARIAPSAGRWLNISFYLFIVHDFGLGPDPGLVCCPALRCAAVCVCVRALVFIKPASLCRSSIGCCMVLLQAEGSCRTRALCRCSKRRNSMTLVRSNTCGHGVSVQFSSTPDLLRHHRGCWHLEVRRIRRVRCRPVGLQHSSLGGR